MMMRFEILTAGKMLMLDAWVVKPCRHVDRCPEEEGRMFIQTTGVYE
jgi:hypothetical protein